MKKKLRRLVEGYGNLKLKQKFLVMLVMWLVPVVIASFFIYRNITNNLIESQLTLARQGYQQVESFLNYRVKHIMLVSSIIALDSNLNDILKQDADTYSLNQQIKDLSTIRSYLGQFQSNDNSNFDTLRLYVPGGFKYAVEDKLLFSLDAAKGTLWYRNTFKGWGWVTCNPPAYVENHDAISVVRPIRDLERHTRMIGAVRIDISLYEIEKILSRINISRECLSYMATTDGHLAGASSYQMLDTLRLNQAELDIALAAQNRFVQMNLQGEKVWAYANYLENIDLILITVLPERELAEGIHLTQLNYVLALSLLATMMILIIVPALNSMTGRIQQLVKRMKLVQQGNLNATMRADSHDEIGRLVDDFNFMLERIDELMKQQYMLGQDLKAAELKALQSQINPHFLYNTLEMIGWMAYKGNPKEIQSMVNTLAQFFRLSLNHGNDITSIANEIKLVKSYLYIQCTRFQNDLKVEVDTKEVEEYAIPKITLQPIVENAILHGILEKDSKAGSITIRGRLKEKDVIELCIDDDGIGMTPQQIETLLSKQSQPDRADGYGLKNIQMRICLFFSIDQAIRIESRPGGGTRVIITIPTVPYYENLTI
ncbi:MAG: sensor histidine kinase [Eubacteriales bacterium]|nr:sensor histidine kinase [Eubacteriales bacterium]